MSFIKDRTFKILNEIPIQNKKVLMRLDLNVPMDQGKILDATRIKEALPSIKYVLKSGGSLILMSHLGRPKNKDPRFSLHPVAKELERLLSHPILFCNECIGPSVTKMAQNLNPHEILLLENLRFYPGETSPEKDPSFAKQLASLAEVYVNDAFGSSHRKHSSIFTITSYFSIKAMGFLMFKEVETISKHFFNPVRPFVALIGGAKVSTKLQIIEMLLTQVDTLCIGGAIAFTFLKAKNQPIGESLFEPDMVDIAKKILEKSPVFLPLDFITQSTQDPSKIEYNEKIHDQTKGLDIGYKTIEAFASVLNQAQTILWNGPMGMYEKKPFNKGTEALIDILASSKAYTLVGGGDSIAALQQTQQTGKISFVSTGGGATLELIQQHTLPGITALCH